MYNIHSKLIILKVNQWQNEHRIIGFGKQIKIILKYKRMQTTVMHHNNPNKDLKK